MAGLTNYETAKKALILIAEAEECVKELIATEPEGHSRSFPYPERRQVLRSLRRTYWDLEHCEGLHPEYVREYTGRWS